MPRYIDADKFIAELEQEKTVALEFEDGVAVYEIEHTMNLIGMQPTADVVPKSEVERLYYNLQAVLEERAETKQEIAREIFEEIEEVLFNNHDLDLHSDYPTPHYYEELKDDIAELKKKYTESEGKK